MRDFIDRRAVFSLNLVTISLWLNLAKACFKRRATAVLSWLDGSSTAERH